MSTEVTRSSSPVVGSSSTQLDLGQTHAALKAVANSVSKSKETRSYLGKGYKPLDYITYINKPALRADLAECTQRLKDIVTTTPDQEKQKKEMLVMLGVIVKSEPASAANSHASSPAQETRALKPSNAQSTEEEKPALTLDFLKNFFHQHGPISSASKKALQTEASPSQQIKQTQHKLSVLLLLINFMELSRQFTLYSIALVTNLRSVFNDKLDAYPNISGDIENNKLYLTMNPTTEEGIAFLCKWSKLINADTHYRFNVNDTDEYYFLYHDELVSEALQSKAGEVQIMASLLYRSMEWNHLIKSNKNLLADFNKGIQQISGFLQHPSFQPIFRQYGGSWLWDVLQQSLAMSMSSATDETTEKDLAVHLSKLTKLSAEKDKLLQEYQNQYEAFQKLESQKKATWQKHNNVQFTISFLKKGAAFPTPEAFAQALSQSSSSSSSSTPVTLDPKESFAFEDTQKKQRPRASSSSSQKQNSLSSSSDANASEGASARESLDATSLSLAVESDSFDDQEWQRRYAKMAGSNPFSSLDISSPRAKDPSAKVLSSSSSASQAFSSSSSDEPRAASPSDSERSPSSASTLSDTSSSSDPEDFTLVSHGRKKAPSQENALRKSSSSTELHPNKVGRQAASVSRPLGLSRPKPSLFASNATPVSSPSILPATSISSSAQKRSAFNKSQSVPSSPERTSLPSFDSPADFKLGSSSHSSKTQGAEPENKRNSAWNALPSATQASRSVPSRKLSLDDIFQGGLQKITYDKRVVLQRRNANDWGHNFPSDFDRLLNTPYARKTEWPDHRTQAMQPHYEIFCKQIPKGARSDKESRYFVMEYCFNQQDRCYHRFARSNKSQNEFTNAIVQRARFKAENPTPAESRELQNVSEEVVEFSKPGTNTFKIITSQEIVQFFDVKGNEYHVYRME